MSRLPKWRRSTIIIEILLKIAPKTEADEMVLTTQHGPYEAYPTEMRK
jgi:hypothetical protein